MRHIYRRMSECMYYMWSTFRWLRANAEQLRRSHTQLSPRVSQSAPPNVCYYCTKQVLRNQIIDMSSIQINNNLTLLLETARRKKQKGEHKLVFRKPDCLLWPQHRIDVCCDMQRRGRGVDVSRRVCQFCGHFIAGDRQIRYTYSIIILKRLILGTYRYSPCRP